MHIKELFEFTYENNASASYLVIKAGKPDKFYNYQAEMVIYNKIENIIAFDVRSKDDEIFIYYNITSKLSLSQYLKKNSMKRNDFINLLSSITRTLLNSKSYLLYDRCFLLEEDYIFINPLSMEISLVYIPFNINLDINSSFKELLSRLIMNSVEIEENSRDNYIQKVLNRVKADSFNVYALDKLLKDMNAGTEDRNETGFNSEMRTVRQTGFQTQLTTNNCKDDKKIPVPDGTFIAKREEHDNAKAKQGYKPGAIICAVVSQAAIITAVILGWNTIKALSGDKLTTYLAILLVIGGVDTLLFKRLFPKMNPSPGDNPQKPVSKPAFQIPHKTHQDAEKKADISTTTDKSPGDVQRIAIHAESTDGIRAVKSMGNETVVLSLSSSDFPCLKGFKNGVPEEIQISKPSFILGRLEGQVDHVFSNIAVGKVHAEILSRDNEYFIKDLNSKNGTFVNDIRIDSNKEYEIKNNDKVSFANSEYVFVLPKQ